jgi:hypothetical protein
MDHPLRSAATTLGMLAAAALLSEVRVRSDRKSGESWRRIPIEPRGRTRLGISFRPLQAEALGLDPQQALAALLPHPFSLIRIAALWSHLEPQPGCWRTTELDAALDAAEEAGKGVILGVGAVKNFGYPELFVPDHRLAAPLPERQLIRPMTHGPLLAAATDFVIAVVGHCRERRAIAAWQVEHEAVDPLGLEHSWRLSRDFVAREIEAVRAADGFGRPVLLNAYLPTSTAVAVQQWWRTRDQGDSIALALREADLVGLDIYPRHALAGTSRTALYLDGSRSPWGPRRGLARVASRLHPGQRLLVTEGQAEPWEAVTVPPSLPGRRPFSCTPEAVITTYNRCLRWARRAGVELDAYLFWGAEYWLRREIDGEPDYVAAFRRVLEESA